MLKTVESLPLLGTQNAEYSQTMWTHTIGNRSYELQNHLGNVLSVISDKPLPHDDDSDGVIDWYLADIKQSTDYSPFGVQLSGRNFTASGAEDFRYGFNGKEGDNEIKGNGNSYDFGARMLDTRLGRWLTIDPLFGKYPSTSVYSFVANRPTVAIDPDGKDIIITEGVNVDGKPKLTVTITGKVVFDYLTTTVSDENKQKYVDEFNKLLKDTYSQAFENIEIELVSNFSLATESEILPTDHVVYVMNLHLGKEAEGMNEPPYDDVTGFACGIGSKKAFFPYTNQENVGPHEVGHWFGLFHPKDFLKSMTSNYNPRIVDNKYCTDAYNSEEISALFSSDNLMHHPGDPGTTETSGMTLDEIQVYFIKRCYDLGLLNKGENKKTGNLKAELDAVSKAMQAKVACSKIIIDKISPPVTTCE